VTAYADQRGHDVFWMTAAERFQHDSDAQAFNDYLTADTQAAREEIAQQLARRGYLTGVMVGAS
jgi:hypothetical protein